MLQSGKVKERINERGTEPPEPRKVPGEDLDSREPEPDDSNSETGVLWTGDVHVKVSESP